VTGRNGNPAKLGENPAKLGENPAKLGETRGGLGRAYPYAKHRDSTSKPSVDFSLVLYSTPYGVLIAGGCANAAPPLKNNGDPSRLGLSPTCQGWALPVSVQPGRLLTYPTAPRGACLFFPCSCAVPPQFLGASPVLSGCSAAVPGPWHLERPGSGVNGCAPPLTDSRVRVRRFGRHGGVIRVRGAAVDLYRRGAGRRGALSQSRPGARGDTPHPCDRSPVGSPPISRLERVLALSDARANPCSPPYPSLPCIR
jgi:hypothetical protein